MHPEAHAFVGRVAAANQYGAVVEIGSRDINGSVRAWFDTPSYWGIDLFPGPSVDEVADAVRWRPATRVDCVVCCEVLEHAPDVEAIVVCASESLRVGGQFIMTCATDPRGPHSAHDGLELRPGEHYGNVAPEEFSRMCRDSGMEIEALEVHVERGDLYAVARKLGGP